MDLEKAKQLYAGSREGIERDIKRRKAADLIAETAVPVEKADEAKAE